jgi:peroxiredoxin
MRLSRRPSRDRIVDLVNYSLVFGTGSDQVINQDGKPRLAVGQVAGQTLRVSDRQHKRIKAVREFDMTSTIKLAAGAAFPSLPFATVAGATADLASMAGWRVLVVYRGKHCPLCKQYFKTLEGLGADLAAAGVSVVTVSADPKEKAEADVMSEGWTFPVGYGLTVDQMRTLGLYVSEPRSLQETDRPFAEPGLFVINPAGQVQIIDISNAPFARPDLAAILRGIKIIQERQYPIRGTLA